jgi:hypothetical protein
MLGTEDFMAIQALASRGVYQCDIAAQLGVHPKTVSRALQRGGAPVGPRRPARGSKLAPYQATVDRLLSEGVWNAVVILREIQVAGLDPTVRDTVAVQGGQKLLRRHPQRPQHGAHGWMAQRARVHGDSIALVRAAAVVLANVARLELPDGTVDDDHSGETGFR